MKTDNSAFWEEILTRFHRSNRNFLCQVSLPFRYVWLCGGEEMEIVREYAGEFLSKHKDKYPNVQILEIDDLLFSFTDDNENLKHHRAIRIDFVKFVIKKFKK